MSLIFACKMNEAEQKAFEVLQQHNNAVAKSQCKLSDWKVKTGKHGLYYLHESSSLAFQTLGAAKVAINAFKHISSGDKACIAGREAEDLAAADEEDDSRAEVLSIATSLDQVLSQLHKSIDTLQAYSKEKPETVTQVSQALQPKIVDMYDVCSYMHVSKETIVLKQSDTLLQRSTKLRCQLLLATCAVFTQKLLHRSSYTSGYRQHCMYTLLQELKRTGPNNPALSLLVEPLLPRAWRKELDKQKLLKDDIDTDLYSRDIAQQDIQQAAAEDGPPTVHDFVVPFSSELAKLAVKMKRISDILDLVPIYKRAEVEAAVAGSVGGLEALTKCLQDFQKKFSKQEAHQDWLEALKEAVVGEGYTNEKVLKDSLTTDGKKAIANDSNI